MSLPNLDANKIIYVDDEEKSCKWFAKTFGSEFNIVTADSAQSALKLLDHQTAIVVCDHRMPHMTGTAFFSQISLSHPWIIRVLTSAYTDKALLIDAISPSGVSFFIEKPWEKYHVMQLCHQALLEYKRKALQQHALHNGLVSTKNTLAFLSHELNTPLATVSGYLDLLLYGLTASKPKHLAQAPLNDWWVQPFPIKTGQFFNSLQVIDTIKHQIDYVRGMLGESVKAARSAMLEQPALPVYVSDSVNSAVQKFASITKINPCVVVEHDFILKQSSDLIHLAICGVIQNALRAMTDIEDASLTILISKRTEKTTNRSIFFICISDSGPGIPLTVIENLKQRRPSESYSGSGTGLLLCKRLIESLSGEFIVESHFDKNSQLNNNVSTQITFLFNESSTQKPK